jgi:hypothetical protein
VTENSATSEEALVTFGVDELQRVNNAARVTQGDN